MADPTLAVAHVSRLAELVPAAERRSFLFACWQEWSAAMTPSQRVALGRAALRGLPDVGKTEEPLRRHHHTLHEVIATHRDPSPVPRNYLLFQHARLTHNRLGVPPAEAALAALVARGALAGRDDVCPAPALRSAA
jgi:hypothetical protein